MNIHKIDNDLHHSFLEEKRKDAITGDLIQAGDEVVFCGICKSAFLKDSWEYMDRKHCGQTKTLNSVPISKPLLLNVSRIVPHFITLVNFSISFEECWKMLSDFSPREKKIEILLNPNLKKALEKPIEKPKPQIRYVATKKQELPKEERSNSYIFPLSLILGFGVSIFPSFVFEGFWAKILFITTVILLIYSCISIYSFFKTITRSVESENETITSLENLEDKASKIETLVTFGIFNHSLFFYFEQIQQGVFIELVRISGIEIQYQSSRCVNLILKKNIQNNKEITIPLIFSKKERITTFLIRLAKTKKGVSNHSQVKLTNFPIDRIRLLKRKLMLYTDIIFEEPKKIEPKKELIRYKPKAQNVSVSLEKLSNPVNLTKSQKVSKQSKNRNHHHQNRHQTQYKNYKRR
ncbi:hypothetical protein WAF17_01190 [Bernardetia sp. ABR2-2B]|uniref:hypothetical protein n=1 Tax=Bernardetia sp. ABR2-2B TaxID=3127472 RepID=UPI0030CAE4BE